MRSYAKRLALIGTAAGLIAAVAPANPAAASFGMDTIHGGCSFDTITPAQVSNTARGVIMDTSATFDATGAPTDATVTCALDINGAIDPNTTLIASGLGEQAGAAQITFDDEPGNSVILCQRVQYADGYDTGMDCAVEPPPPLPLTEIINFLIDTETQLFVDDADPVICSILMTLQGDYLALDIRPDGDLYVLDPFGLFGGPVYDCPPYGDF